MLKLTIPTWAQDLDSEFDKLFIAYMYWIAEEHGFRTQYVIDPRDARTIMQRFMLEPVHRWGDWSRHIHFGAVGKHSWVFRFLKRPTTTVEYEFQYKKSHLIWGYLMGRHVEEEIVTDWTHWRKRQQRSKIHPRNSGQFAYNRGGSHAEED